MMDSSDESLIATFNQRKLANARRLMLQVEPIPLSWQGESSRVQTEEVLDDVFFPRRLVLPSVLAVLVEVYCPVFGARWMNGELLLSASMPELDFPSVGCGERFFFEARLKAGARRKSGDVCPGCEGHCLLQDMRCPLCGGIGFSGSFIEFVASLVGMGGAYQR